MDKEGLHRYFSGDTTPEEEKMIMDWAEASAENYQTYLRERMLWNAMLIHYPSTTQRTTSPADKPTLSHPTKRLNLWAISTVAACALLLVTLSRQLFFTKQPEPQWQSVWVPPGQRAQVELEDGTVVWLNSRSTFTFPTSFHSDKRVVELDGEGYFDVKKDADRQFIVKTKDYSVKVLGTSFNVLAYNDYDMFETSLLEGSVRITSNHDESEVAILQPNETIAGTKGFLAKGTIRNFDHFRWKEGLICLDDETFGNLIAKFSLYFDVPITIENKALLEYRCTGKFRQSDGVEYALKVLQSDLKFSYTRNVETSEIVIQ